MQATMKETTPRRHPVGNLFQPIKTDDDVTVGQVTQVMQGFSRIELQDMLALTYLVKNRTSSALPVEKLIGGLLEIYGWFGGCVTPEDIEEKMGEFRANWADATEGAEGMAQRYPDLFSAVSDDGDKAAAPSTSGGSDSAKSPEDTAAKDDEPAPQTTTAKMAADAFQDCIDGLVSLRSRMLQCQCREENVVDDLAGATLLGQILNDWRGGGFADEFPKEHWLVSAIKGNIGL